MTAEEYVSRIEILSGTIGQEQEALAFAEAHYDEVRAKLTSEQREYTAGLLEGAQMVVSMREHARFKATAA